MLLITTALMLEARPLRKQWGLQSVSGLPYPVFLGEDCILVVTGTGPLKASAATGWALGRFDGITAAVNIGFAGASAEVSALYEWRYVHSIKDEWSGRMYIPDILSTHPFTEAKLLTVARVVRSDFGWDGLVDMEGSGFFEAARNALPPDRIALLKWVSDPLSGTIDAAATEKRFTAAVPVVVEFLNEWYCRGDSDTAEADIPLLQTVLERLRLTRTQEAFMGKWVRGYIARGGDPTRILACLPDTAPAHKTGNTRIFQILKDVLKG